MLSGATASANEGGGGGRGGYRLGGRRLGSGGPAGHAARARPRRAERVVRDEGYGIDCKFSIASRVRIFPARRGMPPTCGARALPRRGEADARPRLSVGMGGGTGGGGREGAESVRRGGHARGTRPPQMRRAMKRGTDTRGSEFSPTNQLQVVSGRFSRPHPFVAVRGGLAQTDRGARRARRPRSPAGRERFEGIGAGP